LSLQPLKISRKQKKIQVKGNKKLANKMLQTNKLTRPFIQILTKKNRKKENKPGFLMALHEKGKDPCFGQVSRDKKWNFFGHF
jgi:hypothetical protein